MRNRRVPETGLAIRDGLNHKFGDPNYDIKQSARASKRMYPDILNYDQVVKSHRFVQNANGRRSFLGVENENGEQIHDGRVTTRVISLNLPRTC